MRGPLLARDISRKDLATMAQGGVVITAARALSDPNVKLLVKCPACTRLLKTRGDLTSHIYFIHIPWEERSGEGADLAWKATAEMAAEIWRRAKIELGLKP